MKMRVCDLCGKRLEREEMHYEIRDFRDIHRDFHCIHWSVCDDCHEELMERHKKVWKDIKDAINGEGSGNCNCEPPSWNVI